MGTQPSLRRARGHVPDTYVPVGRARKHISPLHGEGNRAHAEWMSGEAHNAASVGCVPQFEHPASTSRNQVTAVRRKCNRGDNVTYAKAPKLTISRDAP